MRFLDNTSEARAFELRRLPRKAVSPLVSQNSDATRMIGSNHD